MKKITKEEFVKQYLKRSGVTLNLLKNVYKREPRPCNCGDEDWCQGWQMAYIDDSPDP